MTNPRAEVFAAIRAESEQIAQAEARRLVAIAAACDTYSGLNTHTDELTARVLHGEQVVVPGADGTPGITEFFHLELAMSLGCSPETAQVWTADVLNLRHRHPILWQATLDCDIPVWVARDISRAALQLNFTQAREFDSLWSLRLVPLTLKRAVATTETQVALILNDDKEAERQAAKKQRRVEFTPNRTIAGITDLYANLDAGDAAQLNGTLDRLADVLKAGGSTASRDELRAEALGHLAHPDRARQLLQPSLLDGAIVTPQGDVVNRDGELVSPTSERCRHGAELILHVHQKDLANGRGGEGDALGPVTLQHLNELLARCAGTVKVRPVIDLAAPVMVNTYRPSDELAQRVKLRDRYVMFPRSNRSAFGRGIDLDHTIPAPEGPASSSNLGPLNRASHRARTHAGFRVEQPSPGVFHWKTPAGQEAWVTSYGTWDHPPPDHLINDPAASLSRTEKLLWDTLCNGRTQLEKEQAEAEQAADEARERERLRRARKAQRLRDLRQAARARAEAAKPNKPRRKKAEQSKAARKMAEQPASPELQPALIPNQGSESADPAPF
ncbi:hypothetical protein B0O41_2539 [Propionibacteriaceae bacterium ES.041]|uniref:hypothetical protein n=1 Tax=Enemella evansiae TaxID=2016499 RepID=UPI000B95CAD7|nr:hypothetical protein [Enemella evansiae]OYN94648.1 hypothetical protein CGZ96_17405 [Enemella evansiae]PFG67718.1 hypothetical protein B0O41_2539 [Propionibacteriaceae bacterium ES.041]